MHAPELNKSLAYALRMRLIDRHFFAGRIFHDTLGMRSPRAANKTCPVFDYLQIVCTCATLGVGLTQTHMLLGPSQCRRTPGMEACRECADQTVLCW